MPVVRAPVLSVSAASRFFIFLLYFSVELLFAHSSVQFVGLVRSGPITERVLVFSVGVDCVFFFRSTWPDHVSPLVASQDQEVGHRCMFGPWLLTLTLAVLFLFWCLTGC